MILTLSLTVLVTSIPGFDILGNTELEKYLIYSQLFRVSEEKNAKIVVFEAIKLQSLTNRLFLAKSLLVQKCCTEVPLILVRPVLDA